MGSVVMTTQKIAMKRPRKMNSGRSFYYHGCGGWDLTKKIILMKPLKGVEKNK